MELAYTSKQNSDSAVGAKPLLLYPEDVLSLLKDRNMTRQAKREVLADWASDARTIADAPSLRRLDNGAVIRIDVILEALARLGEGWRFEAGNDGDDDPPPAGLPPCRSPHRPCYGKPLEGGAPRAIKPGALPS
jgi:hypothetical protein